MNVVSPEHHNSRATWKKAACCKVSRKQREKQKGPEYETTYKNTDTKKAISYS